tara:strand:- start:502 stop:1152 length:651 start_codon:yes stop_codon:yes gene_type:complete
MDKLAYDNLKLLNEKHSDSLFLISDHNVLSLIEKDNFDTCSKLKSLEYPIYFTYHHILNIVDYDKDISYKNKMNLLTMIDNSLNNLIDYLDDYEEEQKITTMLDDIYERLDIVNENQKHNYLERFVYLFDDIVDGLREAGRYLYFTPMTYYPLINVRPGDFVEDEGECDSGDESDSTDSSDCTDYEEDEGSEDENTSSSESEESNIETEEKEVKLD